MYRKRKTTKTVQVEAETQKKTKRVQLERKPERVQVKKSAAKTARVQKLVRKKAEEEKKKPSSVQRKKGIKEVPM